MKLHKPICPECGEPAQGTVERLAGCAQFAAESDPQTGVEYSGWTEVWWDEQRTACQNDDEPESPDNLPLVCCSNGHTWPTIVDW